MPQGVEVNPLALGVLVLDPRVLDPTPVHFNPGNAGEHLLCVASIAASDAHGFGQVAPHRQHVRPAGLRGFGSQLDERLRRIKAHVAPLQRGKFAQSQARRQCGLVDKLVLGRNRRQQGDGLIGRQIPPCPTDIAGCIQRLNV